MVTVVVVEKVRLVRESVVHALGATGGLTVVGQCADGDAAVEIVLRERPDVVVIGQGLPGMDGAQTARRIIEAWPRAQILLHAADAAAERAVAAITSGVVAVALDNMSIETLIQTIRVVADH
jgi:DNA-binding NarL/FixJ family response regulator